MTRFLPFLLALLVADLAVAEDTVSKGLRWLTANQDKDGSWGNGTNSTKAETGLALLAFLGHGETTTSDEYGKTVIAGFKFLIADMQTTNRVGGPSAIEHAIATWALCEGYQMTRIPPLQVPAEEALTIIVKGQRPSGLWGVDYRQGNGEDNVEASIWQFIALISGLKMGSKADGLQESLERASKAMEKVLESNPDPGTTAGAVLCLELSGKTKTETLQKALASLDAVEPDWANPTFKDPIFRLNLITQALFQKGGRSWFRWNKLFAPMLVQNQKASIDKGGKVIGFWDSPGSGERYGRVYSTAMSLLTLEVYYRYLTVLHVPYQQHDNENSSTNDVVIKI